MWINIVLFGMLVRAVVPSNTCPSNQFSAVFSAIAEQTVDELSIFLPDPELTFFKDVLKFKDDAIQRAFEDAINFFNYTYGLDFSASQPNENHQFSIENAVMITYALNDNIEYFVTVNNWIRRGNTRSDCYRMRDGGFRVSFPANTTLYGSYGGAEGRPISVGDLVVYGFYIINVCDQSPIIIQFQSDPLRPEPVDGIFIIKSKLYNRVLGNGNAQSLFIPRPDPDQPKKYRISIRNNLSFPAQ